METPLLSGHRSVIKQAIKIVLRQRAECLARVLFVCGLLMIPSIGYADMSSSTSYTLNDSFSIIGATQGSSTSYKINDKPGISTSAAALIAQTLQTTTQTISSGASAAGNGISSAIKRVLLYQFQPAMTNQSSASPQQGGSSPVPIQEPDHTGTTQDNGSQPVVPRESITEPIFPLANPIEQPAGERSGKLTTPSVSQPSSTPSHSPLESFKQSLTRGQKQLATSLETLKSNHGVPSSALPHISGIVRPSPQASRLPKPSSGSIPRNGPPTPSAAQSAPSGTNQDRDALRQRTTNVLNHIQSSPKVIGEHVTRIIQTVKQTFMNAGLRVMNSVRSLFGSTLKSLRLLNDTGSHFAHDIAFTATIIVQPWTAFASNGSGY